MSRSLKKGPFVNQKLVIKLLRQKETGERGSVKTWARYSHISPEMVGHRLAIHNGRKFVEVFITESMVGHRLGEFAATRSFRSHGKVTKRVLEKT